MRSRKNLKTIIIEQKNKEEMNNEIQFILYQLPDEEGRVQVVIKDETIWATQKAMAQLFGVGVPAISKHLAHIFEEGELNKDATVSKMEIVVNRGFRGEILPEKEIRQLERAVTGYFDYIEDLIERENTFNMEQFAASVNEFLTFRRYALLPDKGKITREEADRKAEEEYPTPYWTEIVRIMSTQKAVTSEAVNAMGEKVEMRICSTPAEQAADIYSMLNYKKMPFRKIKVCRTQSP